MVEALYRKYRPLIFKQVVGQKSVVKTLQNALTQEKLSHAYLLCGTRGTGKTTVARILAKALLCKNAPTSEPCGKCDFCKEISNSAHPDVYELDAASRTGVDNVREEIISRVNYASTQGKYKIYIIDEVHMLSTAAFNSLLKTLEEPPKHVVFILCTTDPQMIPATILSRCQRFDFNPITQADISKRLTQVCKAEGVSADNESLQMIAKAANGAMRNALTELEQAIAFCDSKITAKQLHKLKSASTSENIARIIEALAEQNAPSCILSLADIVEQGTNLNHFVKNMTQRLRDLYVVKISCEQKVELRRLGIEKYMEQEMLLQSDMFDSAQLMRAIAACMELIHDLKTSSNARLSLEIFFIKLCGVSETQPTNKYGAHAAPASAVQNPAPATLSEDADMTRTAPEQVENSAAKHQPNTSADKTINAVPDEFINAVKPQEEPTAAKGDRAKKNIADFEPTKKDISDQHVLDQIWRDAIQTLVEKDPPRAIIFKSVENIFFDAVKQDVVLEFAPGQDFSFRQAQKGLYTATIKKAMFLAANGSFKFRITISEKAPEPEQPQREEMPVPQFVMNISPSTTAKIPPMPEPPAPAEESTAIDEDLKKFEDQSLAAFGENVIVSEVKTSNN
ncbi:MAG: DNA polymerase III subunit gamma/tau [Eggerthellaceae bacterium]|nr:DNA polymerase III subunit gamma/tau [Eggerthellaceae bacterium]